MKFSKFIWDLYRDSERGKRALAKFSSITSDFVEPDLRNFELTLDDDVRDQLPEGSITVDIADLVRAAVTGAEIDSAEAATEYFQGLYEAGIACELPDKTGQREMVYRFGEDEEDWYDYIAALSLGLHLAHPSFFLPYGFRRRYHELEEIHRQFGIPLPAIPGKHQKEQRGRFYLEVNSAWQEFRGIHGLGPSEMCALLYDFAAEFVTPTTAVDLPAPLKAWMVTGGSWDIEFADTADDNAVSPWGANAAVRRGDIIVMYLVRPRSCIHSIWRACSDGFIDPVSHYHSTAWIGAPIRTVPITLTELREHPILSQKPAVRGNFQGSNGKAPLSVEEYEALLLAMEAKGQDLTGLPRMPTSPGLPEIDLLSERDVEVKLVEPLLLRLGYGARDWVRQMPVKMGRGERNYPDYAIGAVTARGEESARMVIETKFQLTSQRDFTDAFFQAKSYALRLRSRIMAMAAHEGLWVFPPKNGNFDIKAFVYRSWAELVHPDAFHATASLIGREEIIGRPTQR